MNFQQLTLPISLPDSETFASFYTGDNLLLVNYLKEILNKSGFYSLYYWSKVSAGRTHLLYAACYELSLSNKPICYIPLNQYKIFTPEILLGLEQYDLVCLDDVDKIVGNKIWEEAIFDLFNRLMENNKTKLLITGNASPKQLNFTLPDLASRLEWGQVYQLKELNDDEKLKALQLRASLKGFDLPTEVGHFLLKRVDREMRTLYPLLEQLDKATITEQRKLTIPFIKTIFKL
ncbi:DnaA inactivator Hda [Orbaceae bacterium ac157xtp]